VNPAQLDSCDFAAILNETPTAAAGPLRTGLGYRMDTSFAADYDQFRKVDGVLVPFKEITYAGNTVTSTYQVIEFEWNPPNLDAALKPGSRAFD